MTQTTKRAMYREPCYTQAVFTLTGMGSIESTPSQPNHKGLWRQEFTKVYFSWMSWKGNQRETETKRTNHSNQISQKGASPLSGQLKMKITCGLNPETQPLTSQKGTEPNKAAGCIQHPSPASIRQRSRLAISAHESGPA